MEKNDTITSQDPNMSTHAKRRLQKKLKKEGEAKEYRVKVTPSEQPSKADKKELSQPAGSNGDGSDISMVDDSQKGGRSQAGAPAEAQGKDSTKKPFKVKKVIDKEAGET